MEKSDGIDYWNICKQFFAGKIPARRLHNHSKWRDIHVVESEGKKYVLKQDRSGWGFGGENAFERAFWRLVRGPFYSRLFRRAARARENGCDRFQEIFLVAEKRTLHYCHEAVVLLEYVEGETLNTVPDISPLMPQVQQCLDSLHAGGLAMCDIAVHNLILTSDGIKALDLSCRGNKRVDMLKDVIRAKRNLGITLPVSGWGNRILFHLLESFYTFRSTHFGYRTKKGKLSRRKYFR